MNMLSIIKTAIITIVISFISGVLLDYYKNYAPRIVCTLMRIKSKTYSSRNIKVYSLMIRNISNKTLHNLNINLQGDSNNLKMEYARITKGLKYDIEYEGKDYDVSIPFLSKDDEFTAKVFMPIESSQVRKPVVTLRSPEEFKEINSYKDASAFSQMLNSLFNHKKVIISIMSVLIVVYIGILGGEYYVKTATAKINTENTNKNIIVENQKSSPKSEEKPKTTAKKSSSTAQNKNVSVGETKNTAVNQNEKNSGSSTDNKDADTVKNQNNTENQKEEAAESNTENTENKIGSTDNTKQQPTTSEKAPAEQNKTNTTASGTENNQSTGSSDKEAESSK